MREIGTVLPPLINEVFSWLEKKGVKPACAPFWRYLILDMKGKLEIDVAVPVAVTLPSDKHMLAGRNGSFNRHHGLESYTQESFRVRMRRRPGS
jgi:hypothetical protein